MSIYRAYASPVALPRPAVSARLPRPPRWLHAARRSLAAAVAHALADPWTPRPGAVHPALPLR